MSNLTWVSENCSWIPNKTHMRWWIFLIVNRTNDLLVARLVLWMLVVTEKYWRRTIREEKELTEKNYSNTTWPPNIVWRDSACAWRLKNYVVIGRIKNWDCHMKMICPVGRSVASFFRVSGGRTEKNLSMTIANQIVRRLIVRRMARSNWYEEWKLKMFAGGFVELWKREKSRLDGTIRSNKLHSRHETKKQT